MEFKEIKDKEAYFNKNYIFGDETPKLTDKRNCIHCGEDFLIGDYKVQIENGREFIVCPNAPECDGDLTDWIEC
jgi:ssDNA-binding Zn-finger/Zn-ribbon topoisomerase 1